MGIAVKLLRVQTKLKAPKNQYNDFGRYNYRSCEDILEGLKPLLVEVGATVIITDEIVQIGERYYVKATAIFGDTESDEKVTVSAYAREDDSKKGMDLAQVTGSVSSYARKYALNGLFAIDDTKDSDVTNDGKNEQKQVKETKQKPEKPQQPEDNNSGTISKTQAKRLFAISGADAELCRRILKRYNYSKSDDIKIADYNKICAEVEQEAKNRAL